jgi:GT2 family glycosyltransferase
MNENMVTNRRADEKWVWTAHSSVKVSIVVTAYAISSIQNLSDLVQSLTRQSGLGVVELILVLERDRTLFQRAVTLMSVAPDLNSVLLFYSTLDGMSEARNIGCAFAKGKYVAFVDDDVVLGENWLETLIRIMDDSNAAAATGPSRPIRMGTTFDWIPRELSWLIGSTEWFQQKRTCEIRNVWGTNMVVRREEFLKIGGFRGEFGLRDAARSNWADPPSEDVDVSFRLRRGSGRPILYVPTLEVGHKILSRKLSLLFIAHRAYTTGHQRYAIKRLYGTIGDGTPLSLEHALLPSILFLFPKTIMGLLQSPRNSFRTLSLLIVVTCLFTLGYFDRRAF